MDARSSLLLSIIDLSTFRDTMKTLHNCSLNQTHRSINIMVLYSRDQDFFTLFEKVLLDCANVLNITYVLVELWVNGHMFCPNCKPFAMFVLIFYVKNKGNARGVLGHHFFNKTHG